MSFVIYTQASHSLVSGSDCQRDNSVLCWANLPFLASGGNRSREVALPSAPL